MNKKENRRSARQAAQQAVRRDEHNRRIQHAAVAPDFLRRPSLPAAPDTAATR